jgi:ribosome-associated protein
LAEQWRDRLIKDDDACGEWLQSFPGTDSQQLRALIRQARKDAPAESAATVSQGLAPRQSRAYREIFQLVRAEMSNAQSDNANTDGVDEEN